MFNTLRLRRSRRHFADDSFRYIFLNENIWISIKISLKSIAKGPINNIPALVQIMAWRRPGDKPLSEAMMVRLLTHICVARPQWVNKIFNAIWCHWATIILIWALCFQVMMVNHNTCISGNTYPASQEKSSLPRKNTSEITWEMPIVVVHGASPSTDKTRRQNYHQNILNPLYPGRCGNNFKNIIFIVIIQNTSLGSHYEIAPSWMKQNLINEKSTLVQAMTWCRDGTKPLTSVAVNYRYRRYKSIWKFRSIIDMDFSI